MDNIQSRIQIYNIYMRTCNYVGNGMSVTGWIVDSYIIKTDKYSGIVNVPSKLAT